MREFKRQKRTQRIGSPLLFGTRFVEILFVAAEERSIGFIVLHRTNRTIMNAIKTIPVTIAINTIRTGLKFNCQTLPKRFCIEKI